jgi:hypothetical protein
VPSTSGPARRVTAPTRRPAASTRALGVGELVAGDARHRHELRSGRRGRRVAGPHPPVQHDRHRADPELRAARPGGGRREGDGRRARPARVERGGAAVADGEAAGARDRRGTQVRRRVAPVGERDAARRQTWCRRSGRRRRSPRASPPVGEERRFAGACAAPRWPPVCPRCRPP